MQHNDPAGVPVRVASSLRGSLSQNEITRPFLAMSELSSRTLFSTPLFQVAPQFASIKTRSPRENEWLAESLCERGTARLSFRWSTATCVCGESPHLHCCTFETVAATPASVRAICTAFLPADAAIHSDCQTKGTAEAFVIEPRLRRRPCGYCVFNRCPGARCTVSARRDTRPHHYFPRTAQAASRFPSGSRQPACFGLAK